MKYTKEQAELYKDKYINGFTKNYPLMVDVTIKDGFYIVESKINKLHIKKKY